MRESTLQIGGQTLGLCHWGNTDAPPILLIHGLLQQGASWDMIATPLARAGFFVTAPDLRGHGRSAAVGRGSLHTTLNLLLDIDRTLAALPEKPLVLVGHSLGAVLAGITAGVRPERIAGLVLIEPIPPLPGAQSDLAEDVRSALASFVDPPNHRTYARLTVAARWLQEANPAIPEPLALKLAQRTTEACNGGVRWSWDPSLRNLRRVLLVEGQDRYRQLLGRVEMPTLLIYGQESAETHQADREFHRKVLRDSAEVVVSGTHNLYFESPLEVSRRIEDLARRVLLPSVTFSAQGQS